MPKTKLKTLGTKKPKPKPNPKAAYELAKKLVAKMDNTEQF
jgi:hypothetical protein